MEAVLKTHEEAGRTVTLLASTSGVLALFAVADTIKDSSKAAITELKDLGVTPVMLTGDNAATAKALAVQAGIDDARGNLLPEDKLAAIKDMHAVLWQNIALALGIKAVFLVLAVFGNATMWMAVFADMGASLLVVFNGLRLLRTNSLLHETESGPSTKTL